MTSAPLDMDRILDMLDEGHFPQRAYNDSDVHELEQERVFSRTWQFIGHESEIPESGDYAKRYMVTDPFIFVRDENGEVRVLFNSCTHRGTTLCEADSGNASHFRCPYHGWTFRNTGDLVGLPQKQELYGGLDESEMGLVEAPRVDSYRGFVFASIDGGVPDLEDYMGEDFRDFIDVFFHTTEGGMEVVGKPWRWTGEYNWKAAVENTSGDSYHGQTTHVSALNAGVLRGIDETIDAERLSRPLVETDGPTSGLYSKVESDLDVFWNYPVEVLENLNSNLTAEQVELFKQAAFTSCILFPNLTLVHSDALRSPDDPARPVPFIRQHRPLGPNKTEIWQWVVVPKEAPTEFKKEVYRTCQSSFSPASTVESDDLAVWERVTKPAGSMMAKKHGLRMNFEMGKDEVSGPMQTAEDWTGHGVAMDNKYHELGIRRFHRMWYNAISTEDLRDVSWTVKREDIGA